MLKVNYVVMKMNKSMKKIIKIICLLFIFYSCNAQNKITKKNESIKILQTILIENPNICLDEVTFKNHQIVSPDYIITHLDRVNNSNKNSAAYKFFYKEVKKSFSNEEIKTLKTNITPWSFESWKKGNLLNSKNVLFKEVKNNKACLNKKTLKISEPIFNKNFTKALVFVASELNNSGSYYVKVLIKEDNIWSINGGFPIGTGN